jgi:hypothetical protein
MPRTGPAPATLSQARGEAVAALALQPVSLQVLAEIGHCEMGADKGNPVRAGVIRGGAKLCGVIRASWAARWEQP